MRERSSAELTRLGERAEAAQEPLSPEAGRRVAEVLARPEKAKQPPDCVHALDYLATHDAPQCGELLRVLADGEPDAWLPRQAKDKLAEWRKRQGLRGE